jgi:hypothetical protein
MNWQIPVGPQSVVSVTSAAEMVRSRVAYIREKGSQCNQAKLLEEALEYATLLTRWARTNQPVYERKDDGNRHGKPGPMSDG